MKLLTPLEQKTVRLWASAANNEINWAFVDGNKYGNRSNGDIGLMPRESVADEQLLVDTALDILDAFAWVLTLEVGQ